MRKMMLLAAVAAIAALMLAATPAFAADNDRNGYDDDTFVFVGNDDFCDFFDCNRNDFCDFFDCNDRNDRFCDFFDCNNNNNNSDFTPGISQSNEQEVESGDATQNINVTGGGDNSNQIVGVQGVNNTGNATNNTSVIQTGTSFDGNNNNNDFCDFFDCNDNNRWDRNNDRFCDFFDCNNNFGNGSGGEVEVSDVGNFTISPSQTVTGTQQVNQAAVAVGGTKNWWWK